MNTQPNGILASLGLLILRVGIGGYMLTHGWGKLMMLVRGQFADFGDPIGVGSTLSLILAVVGEFVCPILVVLGLFTRLAAIPVVITMAVAAFVVHAEDPWTMGGDGGSKEPAMLFLIPFLALALAGAGRFSLEATMLPRWRHNKA